MPPPGRARARAADDEVRYRRLVSANFVSAAAYDKVKAAAEAARAELNAAQAQADVARNETSYAVLLADADGVVVETLAEPGQVVAAGQVVVRVAHAGRREAVIELPETLRPAIGSTGRATLYGSGLTGSAKLRQLSDAANRQTRTFEARYVLEGRLADAPLGSTISIQISDGRSDAGAAGTDRRDLRSGQGSRRMAGRRRNASGHVACRANRRPQRRSGFGRRQSQGGRSRRCARCASAARRRARATRAKRGRTKRGRQRREAAMSGFNLSALAVRERSVTLFLLVAISIAGVVAFLTLGRAEDPSFTIKQMTVVTAWPGATAKEMEELVAERLEKRMQELRWYDRTETFTRPGLAFTTVVLRDSTPPADVPEQFYQARKKLGDEAASLAAWRHRSDGERRIFRRDLCAVRAEGEGRASSAPRPRSGNVAPTTAARAGRQEGEHHRRAGGEDLRRVLLRPPRHVGRVPSRHLRRAQQPQRHDARRLDRSQGPASLHPAGRRYRRSAADPQYARRRARPYAEARPTSPK